MSYVTKSLTANETIRARLGLTKWEYLHPLRLILFPFTWITRATTEYAVTDQRIITKTGIITRNTNELRVSAVESVQVKQGILGRILGFGNIIVTGRGNNILELRLVKDVMDAKRKLEEAVF